VELLGYYSNLNPLSVLDDESRITKSRREKRGLAEFDNSELVDVCEWTRLSGLLDWHLRRSWDAHVHLEFGDRFPVGKVAVRDLFVLVYEFIQKRGGKTYFLVARAELFKSNSTEIWSSQMSSMFTLP
jgi:hypothetical protein